MYTTVLADRPHQGDIYGRLNYEFLTENGETTRLPFPFWVVMSQECDLEHDYNAANGKYKDQDKLLQTIVACPAFPADQVKDGIHMQNLSLAMEKWGSRDWKKVLSNNTPRFHAIVSNEIPEIPNLVIDFKRIFSFPRHYLYAEMGNKVASIDVIYRESLAQRYAFYISRIALPDEISS